MVLIIMFDVHFDEQNEIRKLSFRIVCILDEMFVLNMLNESSGMLNPVPKNLRYASFFVQTSQKRLSIDVIDSKI